MQIHAVLNDGDELIVGGTKLQFQAVGDTPLSLFKPRKDSSSSWTGRIIIAIVILTGTIVVGLNQGWF
jgi:hypothetical protein